MIVKVNNQQELDVALKNPGVDIWLLGSSIYTIGDSSQVTAYDSSQVRASHQVAITILNPFAKVIGGIQIMFKQPKTPREWLKNYGVNAKGKVAVLFKGVDENYISPRGGVYNPGTKPVCADWDGGMQECGGGFHFSPHPALTLKYAEHATRFMACPVLISEIKVHENAIYPDKIKAPRVYGEIYEVDIEWNRIEAQA